MKILSKEKIQDVGTWKNFYTHYELETNDSSYANATVECASDSFVIRPTTKDINGKNYGIVRFLTGEIDELIKLLIAVKKECAEVKSKSVIYSNKRKQAYDA